MKKMIAVGIITVLTTISLAGCSWFQPAEPTAVQPAVTEEPETKEIEKQPTEIISYSTQDVPVKLTKETKPFDYTVKKLESMADECGTEYDTGYFEELVDKFTGTEKTVYNFRYDGDSQEPDTYVVTILPNVMEYETLDDFKKDFDQCFAGGDAYPKMSNDEWLLFQSSCGTGFNDGSGRPVGCADIREVVEPSLKFN